MSANCGQLYFQGKFPLSSLKQLKITTESTKFFSELIQVLFPPDFSILVVDLGQFEPSLFTIPSVKFQNNRASCRPSRADKGGNLSEL